MLRGAVVAAGGEPVRLVGFNRGGVEQSQNTLNRVPVVPVRDLPAVVTLAAGVPQSFIRGFVVLVKKHLKLANRNTQIVFVELVRDVEPDGAVLGALLAR